MNLYTNQNTNTINHNYDGNYFRKWDCRNKITNPSNLEKQLFNLYDIGLGMLESGDINDDKINTMIEINNNIKPIITNYESYSLSGLLQDVLINKTRLSIERLLSFLFGINSWLVNSKY